MRDASAFAILLRQGYEGTSYDGQAMLDGRNEWSYFVWQTGWVFVRIDSRAVGISAVLQY